MPLANYDRTVTDHAGNVVPGAQMEVRSETTGLLPQLYSDREGGTPLGNPVTADVNGRVVFYVVGGAYKLTTTYDDEEIIQRDQGIGTAQETDLPPGNYKSRTVTAAGDIAVADDDVIIVVKKSTGENTTVNLPSAATRAGSGFPVIIKDGKGDADSHPITPAFVVTEQCDGLDGTDFQITTPYGHVRFDPLPDGSGWYQLGGQL